MGLHTVLFNAERHAAKLSISILVFGLIQLGIEPRSTVSVADALSTRPVIDSKKRKRASTTKPKVGTIYIIKSAAQNAQFNIFQFLKCSATSTKNFLIQLKRNAIAERHFCTKVKREFSLRNANTVFFAILDKKSKQFAKKGRGLSTLRSKWKKTNFNDKELRYYPKKN